MLVSAGEVPAGYHLGGDCKWMIRRRSLESKEGDTADDCAADNVLLREPGVEG